MKYVFVAMVALMGASVNAEARPSTYEMTCQQARHLVRSRGAVVMNYGYHNHAGHLYRRFVSSGRYCGPGENTARFYAPTTNVRKCNVGYICYRPTN